MNYLEASNVFNSLHRRSCMYEDSIRRKEEEYGKKIKNLKDEIKNEQEKVLHLLQARSGSKNLEKNIDFLKDTFAVGALVGYTSISLKLKRQEDFKSSHNEAIEKLKEETEKFNDKVVENEARLLHLTDLKKAKEIFSFSLWHRSMFSNLSNEEVKKCISVGWVTETLFPKAKHKKETILDIFNEYKRVINNTNLVITDPQVDFVKYIEDVSSIYNLFDENMKKIEKHNSEYEAAIERLFSLEEAALASEEKMNSCSMENLLFELFEKCKNKEELKPLVTDNYFCKIRERKIKIEIFKKIKAQIRNQEKCSREISKKIAETRRNYLSTYEAGYKYHTLSNDHERKLKESAENTDKLMESKLNWISDISSSVSKLRINNDNTSNPYYYLGILMLDQKSTYMVDCGKLIMVEEAAAIEYGLRNKNGESKKQDDFRHVSASNLSLNNSSIGVCESNSFGNVEGFSASAQLSAFDAHNDCYDGFSSSLGDCVHVGFSGGGGYSSGSSDSGDYSGGDCGGDAGGCCE